MLATTYDVMTADIVHANLILGVGSKWDLQGLSKSASCINSEWRDEVVGVDGELVWCNWIWSKWEFN